MPENRGRSAQDQGYGVKQLEGSEGYDPNATMGGVPAAMSGGADAGVQAREMAENEVVRDARRKIMEILAEDEPPARATQQQPATGRVRRKNPGLSLEELSEGLEPTGGIGMADMGLSAEELAAIGGGLNHAVNGVGVDLLHEGYQGGDNEAAQMAESMAGRPQAPAEPTWDWVSVKGVATLRSGKKVPVWTVENKTTGMGMQKPFRVQAPAERIASVLNVTGNVNDPRIKQIHEDYDLYVSLSRQLREAKKLFESGDQDAKRTGQRVASQLRGVKQRLGLG